MIPEPVIWKQVREVALRALDLPGEERSRYVRDACRGDEELQKAVETYLAISTRDADSVEELRLGVEQTPTLLSPGAMVDTFRVVKLLGQGGMGAVYLAIDEKNDRKVALKILSTRARFNRGEHKILAKLEDRFIARLYESGETVEGFPYLAMEYIDGTSLADYCDAQQPTLEERLVLFRKICKGVQAAHQKLVVHGDLTPRNIVVTQEGEPKILDFGIAREVTKGAVEAGAMDRRALTPSFASPEQRRGEMIEVASDVYSLGILLCGLATGRHPLTLDDRMVPVERDEGFLLPSEVLASDHVPILPAPPERAERLKKRMREDVDHIVGKALNPTPALRYQTAAELDEDVGRYLGSFPIKAREATLSYRLRKVVRRRPLELTVACALVIMAVLLMWQYRRAIEGEREALAQAERTRYVNRFVVDLLRPTNPYDQSSSADVSIEGLLEQSSKTVEAGLNEYPDLKASLLSVLGEIFAARGEKERGLELLDKALELQRDGSADLGLAESLLRYGAALIGEGRYLEGDAALAEAEEIVSRADVQSDPSLRARVYLGQATSKLNQADYEATQRLSEKALTVLRDSPENLVELSTSLLALGRVLEIKGHDAQAEALFERALTYAERLPDAENPHVAGLLNSLGTLRYKRGDYPHAEELLSRALAIKGSTLGEDDRSYAITLHNLAAVDVARGDYEKAEARFTRVVSILKEAVPNDHISLLTAQDQLAAALVRLQEFGRAEEILSEILRLERENLPQNHPTMATTLNNFAYLYQEQGQYERAETMYWEALGIFEALVGRKSRPVATLLGNLGYIAHSLGDERAAEERYQEALAITKGMSERTPEGVLAILNLVTFNTLIGDLEEARSLADEALPLAESVVGADHWLTGSVHLSNARLLLAEGDASEAVEEARQARLILGSALPAGDSRLAAADGVLGAALGGIGEREEAERLLLHSLAELRRLKGDKALPTREAKERVRLFYEHLGRADEAARYGGSG